MTDKTTKTYPYKLKCFNPACSSYVGYLILIAGAEFFQAGTLITSEAHGICTSCGHPFHWSSKVEFFSRVYKAYTSIGKNQPRERF